MAVWIAVASGSAFGAVLRHAFNGYIHQRNLASTFPLGIFAINVLGSLLIGVVTGAIASERLHLSYEMRTFVIVGVLGGFTTFSSFSFDTLTLLREGHQAQAIGNVVGQVGLSLIAVWAGFRVFAR